MRNEMNDFLAHYGVIGMHWGVRNYQNYDGSLTAEGRRRYGVSAGEVVRAAIGRKKKRQAEAAAETAQPAKAKETATDKKTDSSREQRESFVARHKPTSLMTEEELRSAYNRLNMERSLKQVRDDLSGKNKPKKSFAQKHPVLQQLVVNTSMNVASTLITNQLRTKADELLAPRRMERAKEKGMLNKDLFPFVYNNSGRISSYHNGEKAKADAEAKVLERIKTAVGEVRKEGERNTASAVAAATKIAREESKHNANEASRVTSALYDRKVRDAVESVRSAIKNSGSARERSAKRSVLDDLLKELYGKKG